MTRPTPSTSDIRHWAQENGIKVADRGRISTDVVNAWEAAHPPVRKITSSKPLAPKTKPETASTPRKPRSLPGDDTDEAPLEPREVQAELNSRLVTVEKRLDALERQLSDAAASTPAPQRRKRFGRG